MHYIYILYNFLSSIFIINQFDFGTDHLVMSMCRVKSSLVLLEMGDCYDQCVLLAKLCQPLLCFILNSKAKLACYPRCLLTSYFCIPVPYDEKDRLFGVCQFQKGLQVLTEPFSFGFFSVSGWGIDLDYCDTEWLVLEMNRDYSAVLSRQC